MMSSSGPSGRHGAWPGSAVLLFIFGVMLCCWTPLNIGVCQGHVLSDVLATATEEPSLMNVTKPLLEVLSGAERKLAQNGRFIEVGEGTAIPRGYRGMTCGEATIKLNAIRASLSTWSIVSGPDYSWWASGSGYRNEFVCGQKRTGINWLVTTDPPRFREINEGTAAPSGYRGMSCAEATSKIADIRLSLTAWSIVSGSDYSWWASGSGYRNEFTCGQKRTGINWLVTTDPPPAGVPVAAPPPVTVAAPPPVTVQVPPTGGNTVSLCPNTPTVCGVNVSDALTLTLPAGFPSLSSAGSDLFAGTPLQSIVEGVKQKIRDSANQLCTVVPFYRSDYIKTISGSTAPLWFNLFPGTLKSSMVSACGRLADVISTDPARGYLMVAAALPVGTDPAICLATVWCDKEFLFGFNGVQVSIPIVPEVLSVTVGLRLVAWASLGLAPQPVKVWECQLANSADLTARFGSDTSVSMKPNLGVGGFVKIGVLLPASKPLVELGIEAEMRLWVNMDPAGTGIGVGADHEVGFTAAVQPKLAVLDPSDSSKTLVSFNGPTALFTVYWKYMSENSYTVGLGMEVSWSLGDVLKSLVVKDFDIGGKIGDALTGNDLSISTKFNIYVRRSTEGIFWGLRCMLDAAITVSEGLAKLLGISQGNSVRFGFILGAQPNQIPTLTFTFGVNGDMKYVAVPQIDNLQGGCFLDMMCKSNLCCQSQGGVCAPKREEGGCCGNNFSPLSVQKCPADKPYCNNIGDVADYKCYAKQPNGAGCATTGDASCASDRCCLISGGIGKCCAKEPDGTLCAIDSVCASGQCCNKPIGICWTGTCKYPQGGLCAFDNVCQSNKCCYPPLGQCSDRNGGCKLPYGSSCASDDQCSSNQCCYKPIGQCGNGGDCKLPDRRPCGNNDQCQSGVCCWNLFSSNFLTCGWC